MANVKFEECFLKNKKRYICVEDLKEVYDKHDGSYDQDYYGNFFCPECRIAQLSFRPNAQTPYFSSRDKHLGGCSYSFVPADKRQLEKYCDDKRNHEAINRKLNSCLDLLGRYNNREAMDVNVNSDSRKKQEQPLDLTINAGTEKRSIPRKKLSAPFDKDDYNTPKMFYGTVLLEWNLRCEAKYLKISNMSTGRYICSVTVSNNIYSYIDDSMKFEGKKICNIAFLSAMEKKERYKNCKIKYSTELVIRS